MVFDNSHTPIVESFAQRDETYAPAAQASSEPAPADKAADGTIDQVRELLFGPARRDTDQRIQELHESINALRADMMSLFADLESRMADGDAAVEQRHLSATQGIGSAIANLGAQILKISEPSSG
jgi:hypothetical protein